MKKLGKLKLHELDESLMVLDSEHVNKLKGGEFPYTEYSPYCLPEVVVCADRYYEPFNLWGPGSVYGTNNYIDNSSFVDKYWNCWGSSSANYYCVPNVGGYTGGGGGTSDYSITGYGYNSVPIYATYGTGAYAVALAMTYEGKFEEIKGKLDNLTIVDFLKQAGISDEDLLHDETPWCAAFVNYILKNSGLNYANTAYVPDWQSWGHETNSPQAGDIYINSQGTHMGIVVSVEGNRVTVISGNSEADDSLGTVHSYTISLDSFKYRTNSNDH
jgi:uncharacterized protein (TIGR02594 family)